MAEEARILADATSLRKVWSVAEAGAYNIESSPHSEA